jgi:hypothetical protein
VGPAGSSANIAIYDEGNLLVGAVSSIKFVGAGITATNDSGNFTVTVTATGNATGNGTSIVANLTGIAVPSINQQFTGNGQQTVFALSSSVAAATDLLVTVDTVIQTTPNNYSVSGNQLTFLAAPSNGSIIGVRTFGSYSSSSGFVDRFTGNGSQAAYTISGATLSSKSLLVFVDGVHQIPDVDFTLAGTTLTFTEAPDANSNVVIQSLNNTVGTDLVVASTISDHAPFAVNTAAVALDSFSTANYRTAKYVISISKSTEYQATEAMLVHNGVNVQLVTYALLYTGNAAIMTFSANIVANTVYLWGTGVASGNAVKIQKTYVKV